MKSWKVRISYETPGETGMEIESWAYTVKAGSRQLAEKKALRLFEDFISPLENHYAYSAWTHKTYETETLEQKVKR